MRKTAFVTVLVLLIALLTACGSTTPAGSDITPTPVQTQTPTAAPTAAPTATDAPTPAPTATPTPVLAYTDPLTGEARADQSPRIVAIMINNVQKALPQPGIAAAQMVIEIPTEGETNRLMSLYTEWEKLWAIGSVRSARDYFVDIAADIHAVYMHFGGSPQAYALLKKVSIPTFDGIDSPIDTLLYWRDAERIKNNGSEHSVLTSGDKIANTLKKYGVNTTTTQTPLFNFAESPAAHSSAVKADTVSFSSTEKISVSFKYQDGVYLRSQYGRAHNDGTSGKQVAVENVLILETDIARIPGDESLRLTVRTTGTGKGWLIRNGQAERISWERPDGEFFKVYDYDGKPTSLQTGRTWISIVRTGTSVAFTG